MSFQHLGEQIDIHGGGNDLIFPHHENEIAQSESLTGKPFARYWVHNGMLQLHGEKMSKSLGNIVSVEEFLSEHDGNILRMVILNAGYRKPLKFNEDVIKQAKRAWERLRAALRPASQSFEAPPQAVTDLAEKVKETRVGFEAAMDDDFNTPGALGHLFELVRAINQARDAGVGTGELGKAQEDLRILSGVLGLELEVDQVMGHEAASFIDLLIEVRQELRQVQQWTLADLIRDRLVDLGVILEDGKGETTWRIG